VSRAREAAKNDGDLCLRIRKNRLQAGETGGTACPTTECAAALVEVAVVAQAVPPTQLVSKSGDLVLVCNFGHLTGFQRL
jgi:hypothetical protein